MEMSRIVVREITARSSKSILIEVEEGKFLLIEAAGDSKEPATLEAKALPAPVKKRGRPRKTEAKTESKPKAYKPYNAERAAEYVYGLYQQSLNTDKPWFKVPIEECIGLCQYTRMKKGETTKVVYKEDGDKYILLHVSPCMTFGFAENEAGWKAPKSACKLW